MCSDFSLYVICENELTNILTQDKNRCIHSHCVYILGINRTINIVISDEMKDTRIHTCPSQAIWNTWILRTISCYAHTDIMLANQDR